MIDRNLNREISECHESGKYKNDKTRLNYEKLPMCLVKRHYPNIMCQRLNNTFCQKITSPTIMHVKLYFIFIELINSHRSSIAIYKHKSVSIKRIMMKAKLKQFFSKSFVMLKLDVFYFLQ